MAYVAMHGRRKTWHGIALVCVIALLAIDPAVGTASDSKLSPNTKPPAASAEQAVAAESEHPTEGSKRAAAAHTPGSPNLFTGKGPLPPPVFSQAGKTGPSAPFFGPAFWSAFGASITMIIVSELGDKTFFIAAIMAMRHSRTTVFVAALGALALMTVLSAVMGVALPNMLPKQYVDVASTGLFLVFGVRLLYDAFNMDANEPNEELEEVEDELNKKELDPDPITLSPSAAGGATADSLAAMETGEVSKYDSSVRRRREAFLSAVFVQCFTMTFLAEWGDRSQIATIAMAASKDPYGVTIGGVIGHGLCTGLAVVGGKLLASRISERTVATVGGILFLLFAAHAYMYPESAAA